ncbi:MAG TPA: hypothetical protein DCM05_15880 [Elusimicrobia bacterium]|nr:hypothetical protein [Elusimicrobiota bacterium]
MAKLNIQLSKQQQQILVLAVLFLGGGGFAYIKYFWLPTADKIEQTKAEIKTTEDKINKAKSQAVRLPKIQKEIETLNEQAIEAEKRLPKSRDLPAVITAVSVLARKYNVQLNAFQPGGQKAEQYFIENPYQINIRGNYHDVGRFLAAIALEQRIYNVRTVTYSPPDQQGKATVSFTLVAYQYKG